MASFKRFHQKVDLYHSVTNEDAVAELKVFEVPVCVYYPEGLKFSLFLVFKNSGNLIVGIDNHRPKGPHLHIGSKESIYIFRNLDELLDDFWDLVKKKGFKYEAEESENYHSRNR